MPRRKSFEIHTSKHKLISAIPQIRVDYLWCTWCRVSIKMKRTKAKLETGRWGREEDSLRRCLFTLRLKRWGAAASEVGDGKTETCTDGRGASGETKSFLMSSCFWSLTCTMCFHLNAWHKFSLPFASLLFTLLLYVQMPLPPGSPLHFRLSFSATPFSRWVSL